MAAAAAAALAALKGDAACRLPRRPGRTPLSQLRGLPGSPDRAGEERGGANGAQGESRQGGAEGGDAWPPRGVLAPPPPDSERDQLERRPLAGTPWAEYGTNTGPAFTSPPDPLFNFQLEVFRQ